MLDDLFGLQIHNRLSIEDKAILRQCIFNTSDPRKLSNSRSTRSSSESCSVISLKTTTAPISPSLWSGEELYDTGRRRAVTTDEDITINTEDLTRIARP
jgi:hypothetical protein